MRKLKILNILLVIAYTCCSCSQESKPETLPAIQVTAIEVEPQTIPAVFEYVGIAQSSHLVEIRARVEGYLDKIAFHEGEPVQEGELLFQIDPKPFEAALAQAKALLEQENAILWDAQRSVERLKPLYEQKAASRRDLDNALAEEQRAKAAVDAAKAQVLQTELNLGYTSIHAPISGLSGESKLREGSLVGPGEKSLLTTVSALDPIWVNFNVSEGDLLKYEHEAMQGHIQLPLDLNFEIEVVLANGKVFPSKGKVDFAAPSFQTGTGSMSVRAVLPNPHQWLRPGQFVRARLLGATYPNAIAIPQKAVMQGKKGLFVYVVDKDSKAEMRPIEAGDWYKDDWIIKSGLHAGDKVIVDGINKLMPGMDVQLQAQNGQKE